MTEFELFVSWLKREKIEHRIEQVHSRPRPHNTTPDMLRWPRDAAGGLDISIQDTYSETLISFLDDGTFSFISSNDQ